MQFVPPTHEQTPMRCSACHVRFVCFGPASIESAGLGGYAPHRCMCGHLEEMTALPPGRLFGAGGDLEKRYHPLTRPN